MNESEMHLRAEGDSPSIAAVLPLKITGRHYRENFGRLDVLLSSLVHFADRDLLQELVIVTPETELGAVQQYARNWRDLPLLVVGERDHFAAFGKFTKTWQLRPWQRQQIIKLNSPSLTQADFILTLDPDVILCRPASRDTLAPNGYALLQEEGRRVHSRWWRDSAALLGVKADLDKPGMSVTPALLSRDILLALHDRLSLRARRPWMDVLLTSYSDWTEYTLYLLTAEELGLTNRHHRWCSDSDAPKSVRLHVPQQLSIWENPKAEQHGSLAQALAARIDRIFTSDHSGMFAVVQSNTLLPPSLLTGVASRHFTVRPTDVDMSIAPEPPPVLRERLRTAARLAASGVYRLRRRLSETARKSTRRPRTRTDQAARLERRDTDMLLDHPTWPRMAVGNVVVDLLGREDALAIVRESLARTIPLGLLSANLHYLHEFVDHPAWTQRRSARSVIPGELRWLTLLDGMPLVRKANSLTGGRWPSLAGSDLIEPVLVEASGLGKSVGFLGGTAETHNALRQVLGLRFPKLRIAGTWAPAKDELLDPVESERLAAAIRDSRTDVLVVALSKPLQEDWIAGYGRSTGSTLFLSFGAAIDFLAGQVQRAPRLVSEVGAEWLWRLALDPQRLWRRYLVEGPPTWIRLRRTARLIEW